MMTRKIFMLTVAAALAVAAFVQPASAQGGRALAAEKSQCVVGEQADGYLGIVDGASASEEVRREVRSVNQQRKAAYARLAERNGVTVEVTAALTAERLIEREPSGNCVRDQNGRWVQK